MHRPRPVREATRKRQLEACLKTLSLPPVQVQKAVRVSETISGMLPAKDRAQRQDLIADPAVKHIHVESCRAVARRASAAEEFWQLSKDSGTEIVCSDFPAVFRHNCSPCEKFLRQIVMANEEFHRDLAVARLQDGLARARASSSRRTQMGNIKYNGTKSILEGMKLTYHQKHALKTRTA